MAEEKKTSPIPEEEQPEAAAPGAPEGPPVPEPGAQGVPPGMEGPPVPENKVIDLSSVRAGAGQEQQQTGPEAGPPKGIAIGKFVGHAGDLDVPWGLADGAGGLK